MCGKIEKLSDQKKNWCGTRYVPRDYDSGDKKTKIQKTTNQKDKQTKIQIGKTPKEKKKKKEKMQKGKTIKILIDKNTKKYKKNTTNTKDKIKKNT